MLVLTNAVSGSLGFLVKGVISIFPSPLFMICSIMYPTTRLGAGEALSSPFHILLHGSKAQQRDSKGCEGCSRPCSSIAAA